MRIISKASRDLLLLALLTFPIACRAPAAAKGTGIAGDWQGVVLLPQIRRNVVIHLRRRGGEIRGTMDIPSTMSIGVGLINLKCADSSLEFSLSSKSNGDWRFQGKLEKGSLQGTINGRQLRGSFALKRSDSAPTYQVNPLDESWRPAPHDSWPTDGWQVTTPAMEGLDPTRLLAAEVNIEQSLPEVRSLIVVRHGRIAFERYFRGATVNDAANTKSVTKSVTSALVGIALREGVLNNLDQTVASLLPEYFGPQTDPRKRKITLRHLLTMTAGIDWTENGPVTFAWHRSHDFAQFLIELPQVAEPGQTGRYNTALSHLLSVILTRQSGLNTREFAEEYLFRPVGIRPQEWSRDSRGYYMGGVDLYLTPRDMARFGLLYLNLGRWNDRQIVPTAWVRESMSPKLIRDPLLHNYGYLWWLVQDDDLPAFAAIGYGGQLIYVCPKLDMVVVMTSTIANPHNDVLNFVREFVAPAAMTQPS